MSQFIFDPPSLILYVAGAILLVGIASVLLKKGKKGAKIAALIVIIAIVAALLFFLYRPTTLTISADGFEQSALRSFRVAWSEVESAYLESNLPVSEYRPTVRQNGAAVGSYRSGRFLLSNGRSAQVMMERDDKAVVIVTADRVYLYAPQAIEELAAAVDRYFRAAGGPSK